MLFLDGKRIAEGPERSGLQHWHYGEVTVPVSAGEHILSAQLLALGPALTAYAQMSLAPGLYVQEDSNLLSPDWQYQLLDCRFVPPVPDWGTYARLHCAPGCNLQAYRGVGGEWQPVILAEDCRELHPPQLPPMKYLPDTDFRQEQTLFHFAEYALRWGVYHFQGPGQVKIRHLEPAYASASELPPATREHNWDILQLPPGEVVWHDYWFRAGQTTELQLEGGAVLKQAEFFRTGYPHRYKVDFTHPNPAHERLLELSRRTFECCTFETYMDCPFYEQLMYVGDTRVQALITYTVCSDWRLPQSTATLAGLLMWRAPRTLSGRDCRASCWGGLLLGADLLFFPVFLSMVHDYAACVMMIRCRAQPVCGCWLKMPAAICTRVGCCACGWNFGLAAELASGHHQAERRAEASY